MLLEPYHVRVWMSIGDTGGRPSKIGVPSPAMLGKNVKCSSPPDREQASHSRFQVWILLL